MNLTELTMRFLNLCAFFYVLAGKFIVLLNSFLLIYNYISKFLFKVLFYK